jgi:hypothetical protein
VAFELVRGGKVVGTYASQNEALKAGTLQFGLGEYSVHRVGEGRVEVTAPALSLGILNATDPSTVRS